MKVDDLKQDIAIKTWFISSEMSDNSKKIYLRGMSYYTELTDMSPTELIKEANHEVRKGFFPSERSIKTHIINFRAELKDPDSNIRIKDDLITHSKSNLSDNTISSYLTSVYSFYKWHEIDIPRSAKGKVKGRKTESLLKNRKIPNKNEIMEMLKYTNSSRNKAIILLGATAGLAKNEIINLKVSDFLNGYDERTGITTFSITRKKNSYSFTTFCSPMCSEMIIQYIHERNNPYTVTAKRVEHIKIKKRINEGKHEEEYLFISDKVPDTYLPKLDENERKLNPESIQSLYRRLRFQFDKTTKKGEWSLLRSHKMRAWFNNTLYEAGANGAYIEYMMAHLPDKTKAAYRDYDIEKIKKMYMNHLPLLEFRDVEVHIIEDEGYEELNYKYTDLMATVRDLQEEKIHRDMYKDVAHEKELAAQKRQIDGLVQLIKKRDKAE